MKRTFRMSLAMLAIGAMSAAGGISFPRFSYSVAAAQGQASFAQAVKVAEGIEITSKAGFLMEANSGKVLFGKDENKRLPIASMVKITTLAVIYDALESGQIKMSDEVMVSRNASGMGGSQAFLDFDSTYKVEDLVKSIIIASANDSCVAMAELIAGSEEAFVGKMNELGTKLGMTDTNYVNCTGLPAVNSYSCAADVAKVYSYIMKSPFYGMFNKIWMYDLTHPSGRVTGLTNTNKHVRFFDGCDGGKTGFTAEAGHCITVTASRKNLRPIAVIIGASDSKTRFAESAALMNHVFNNYENRLVVDSSEEVASIRVKKANVDSASVFAAEDFYELCKRGDKNAPQINIEISDSVKAPVKRGEALGRMIVTEEGKVIKEIDLVVREDISELSYLDAIKKVGRKFKI